MTDNICIPESALRNHLTFRDWYKKVSYEMFQDPTSPERFDIIWSDENRSDYIETIMKEANLIYYGKYELIDYKTKNRKFSTRKTDIVAATCVIILNNFKITYTRLASFFGVNHATMIYYVKRHASHCESRDYRNKYINLLTRLQNEGIIPPTKNKRHNPQQLVSTLLSRVESKARAANSRGNRGKKIAAAGNVNSKSTAHK